MTISRTTALKLFPVACLATIACGGNDATPPVTPATPPAASAAPATSTAAAPVAPGHSIDVAAMNTSVKPGADFFDYANGGWYAKTEIPADRGSTGIWLKVTDDIERRTHDLLEDAAKGGSPDQKKIGDYYAAYMNDGAIEAAGTKPLAPTLRFIKDIKDAASLAKFLGSSIRADVDVLNSTHIHTDHVMGLWVEQDLNDPSRAAPYLLQGGLGMPDRSYYLDDSPRMAGFRAKYQQHLATLFKLAGMKDGDARAARVAAFEKKLAETHASRVDTEDVTKGNNPWAAKDFATKAPGMDWTTFFKAAGLGGQSSFIVWHPSAMKGLAALVKSEPLATWKDYLTVRAIDHDADLLPKAFADESFAFYATELQGVPTRADRWKLAVRAINDDMGDAVGKVYVAKYFPPESKAAVQQLVANIVTAFQHRIDALTWMSPATKAKAKEKVAALYVGIGYPDVWRDDTQLVVSRDDALGNYERAELFTYQNRVALLGKPMNRSEWAMVPQIVNAVNLPIRNALNFPAGILAAPFFDPNAPAAANYGSIGSVIGHEISHSFDDEGAKFDAHGRYANWWTPEDFAHFEASGAALAAQFSTYHPFPDAAVDGKLTLSESIADLAGLAASYDAWQASLGGQPAPTQDGFTGDQQFFLAFAQGWQSKYREPLARQRLTTDGHAPPHYRVFTVRNLDAWYPAFGVQPGDPMFLDPPARVRVW